MAISQSEIFDEVVAPSKAGTTPGTRIKSPFELITLQEESFLRIRMSVPFIDGQQVINSLQLRADFT